MTAANTGKKKKTKRKLTPFMKLICYVLLLVSGFMLFQVGQEMYRTFSLRKQFAEVQKEYQKVQDENKYLVTEQQKLEDPNYVQSYARGNFMLTKDGEQIFYLPEEENK